jgi:hypothetical protein
VLSAGDPNEKVRNALKASLRKRLQQDGVKSALREIKARPAPPLPRAGGGAQAGAGQTPQPARDRSAVCAGRQAYADGAGKMRVERFRAAMLRLGLKMERGENLPRAFAAFAGPDGLVDIYDFAAALDADYEMARAPPRPAPPRPAPPRPAPSCAATALLTRPPPRCHTLVTSV